MEPGAKPRPEPGERKRPLEPEELDEASGGAAAGTSNGYCPIANYERCGCTPPDPE